MSVAPRPSARLPINTPVGQQRAAFASRPRSHSPSSSPPQPTDEDEEEEEAMPMSDGEGVPPHEQDEPSPSPAAAASASSSSLVRLVSSDGSLPAAARARLLPAARLLEAAIHSDILAHILALYHYVRLQRAMTLELHVGVKAAAHRLNGWLSAAYAAAEDGGDGHASGVPECVRRIKHDACRVYTILNDADDSDSSDEAAAAAPWWPQLLQSLCAGGRRPTHALAVLRALNRHHGAICGSYPSVAVRHQLYSYYLRTKCWSARQVEEDLQADGVIDAEADAEEPKQEDEDAEAKQEEQEAEAEAESLVPHSKRARVSQAPVRRRDAAEAGDDAKEQGENPVAPAAPAVAAAAAAVAARPVRAARVVDALEVLLQPIWAAMRELDADNIHRLVLKGPPPADGSPLLYHPRVVERRSDRSSRFGHLVIDLPPLWQAELYGCLKNGTVSLDPTSFCNGYRTTLQLVGLAEEETGLARATIAKELRCRQTDAVGATVGEEEEAEEEEKSEHHGAAARASSATERILSFFAFLELQWAHWNDPLHKPAPPAPPIHKKLYLYNLSPADLRGGEHVLAAEDDEDDADPASFFHPPSRDRVSLCQDHWKSDPRSLYHLLQSAVDDESVSCPGLFEALQYVKDGHVFFPMHGEQLNLTFTHHQLSGDTLWIILQPGQHDKLRELAYRIALARRLMLRKGVALDESKLSAAQKQALRDVAWVLFRAKMLVPPLSLLRELDIEWRAEFVQAGRVITGDGDAVHFGLSISDAETVSFATNQLDLDYLERGPDEVLRHMGWVERMQKLHTAGELRKWLDLLHIEDDWLRLALNHAPPGLTCTLFTALKRDLTSATSQHREGEKHSYSDAYSKEHLTRLHAKGGVCERILAKLHACKPLLQAHYEDVAEGGRNLTLCAHASSHASRLSEDDMDE